LLFFSQIFCTKDAEPFAGADSLTACRFLSPFSLTSLCRLQIYVSFHSLFTCNSLLIQISETCQAAYPFPWSGSWPGYFSFFFFSPTHLGTHLPSSSSDFFLGTPGGFVLQRMRTPFWTGRSTLYFPSGRYFDFLFLLLSSVFTQLSIFVPFSCTRRPVTSPQNPPFERV